MDARVIVSAGGAVAVRFTLYEVLEFLLAPSTLKLAGEESARRGGRFFSQSVLRHSPRMRRLVNRKMSEIGGAKFDVIIAVSNAPYAAAQGLKQAVKTAGRASSPVEGEYFYSPTIDRYVSRKPLKVDARTVKAADKLGIKLSWDDEGRINYISRDDGTSLLRELGAEVLSPSQFWRVYNDAVEAQDTEMIKSLTSKEFAEWLDVHFIEEDGKYCMVEHPAIVKNEDGSVTYMWKKVDISIPTGRPGWFAPKDNIASITGIPKTVEMTFQAKRTTWKYWDFFTSYIKTGLGAIRGYVISSGTPSLDLGIPPGARQPVLMLREVYHKSKLPQPLLDAFVVQEGKEFVEFYEKLTGGQISFEEFYKVLDKFLTDLNGEFFVKEGSLFRQSQEREVSELRENISKMLGLMRLLAKSKGDEEALSRLDATARRLFGIEKPILNTQDFEEFIGASRDRLREAIKNKKPFVFVKELITRIQTRLSALWQRATGIIW